ncbi:gamma-parvin isoform X2 [Phacochoerus africanus]|uniref:gamma-parvin isoform X2 n=1 Tax=Phacochoerus africanus TaxID=41426 RepID=UPI001FD9821B|nr:gamma-parvin isoform X2 [Phacochoerus africanus]
MLPAGHPVLPAPACTFCLKLDPLLLETSTVAPISLIPPVSGLRVTWMKILVAVCASVQSHRADLTNWCSWFINGLSWKASQGKWPWGWQGLGLEKTFIFCFRAGSELLKILAAEPEHGMILRGNASAPGKGHGQSCTPCHPRPSICQEPAPHSGEKRKYLPPTSRKDPRFEELQKALMEWINTELLPEHIVVRSLEEDMFDGLILHHLFQKLAGLKLNVEEIALTSASQRRKLTVVLEAANKSLQVEESQAKWSVESIFNKDLLATLHLLVALAKRFQPSLPLPANVQVEVITMESTKSGLKSEKSVEQLTEWSTDTDQASKDVFDELFKLAPEKVNAVKEAIVNFVNQNLDRLGLSVQNLDTQFADGVILLLLIGQLEGFFLHLKEFYLTPNSPAEMADVAVEGEAGALGLLQPNSLPAPQASCL